MKVTAEWGATAADGMARLRPVPRARALAALLAAAVACGLLVSPAVFGQDGGGAGDQQYQDPFGSSQTKTTTTKQRSSSSQGEDNGLSQTPNLGPAGTTTGSSPAPAAAAPAATGSELPRTGGDTGSIALLGAAFLAMGIGLRLRMADASR